MYFFLVSTSSLVVVEIVVLHLLPLTPTEQQLTLVYRLVFLHVSWQDQVMIMLMELPLTHQETSMWQEPPIEDWMVIPVQAKQTSSWLSTTPVVLGSGRSRMGQIGMMKLEELRPTHPGTSM